MRHKKGAYKSTKKETSKTRQKRNKNSNAYGVKASGAAAGVAREALGVRLDNNPEARKTAVCRKILEARKTVGNRKFLEARKTAFMLHIS